MARWEAAAKWRVIIGPLEIFGWDAADELGAVRGNPPTFTRAPVPAFRAGATGVGTRGVGRGLRMSQFYRQPTPHLGVNALSRG